MNRTGTRAARHSTATSSLASRELRPARGPRLQRASRPPQALWHRGNCDGGLSCAALLCVSPPQALWHRGNCDSGAEGVDGHAGPPQALWHRGNCDTNSVLVATKTLTRHKLSGIAGTATLMNRATRKLRIAATSSLASRELRRNQQFGRIRRTSSRHKLSGIAGTATASSSSHSPAIFGPPQALWHRGNCDEQGVTCDPHQDSPPQALWHRGNCDSDEEINEAIADSRHKLSGIAGTATRARNISGRTTKAATSSLASRELRLPYRIRHRLTDLPPQALWHRGNCDWRGAHRPTGPDPATSSLASRELRPLDTVEDLKKFLPPQALWHRGNCDAGGPEHGHDLLRPPQALWHRGNCDTRIARRSCGQ